MPLWLDMLRTPMAAPETRMLRRSRHLWQLLCVSLAISILCLRPLRALAGPSAGVLCAALLFAVLVSGFRYFRAKNAADDAWLAGRGREGEP
ncbi:hypothetical protein DFR49_0807 [Hephaestia caeni]|uniref:DUF202 domain-containing protein n=2 Tax=Hephaestia caeni TaxID=645617 RepID=A0A397PKR7_9SPHN|nr:hypothetical protein [Hephaestia caeni]RIA46271.1 hypothetical protein DFR49_0807 [Hephaestia caeni]